MGADWEANTPELVLGALCGVQDWRQVPWDGCQVTFGKSFLLSVPVCAVGTRTVSGALPALTSWEPVGLGCIEGTKQVQQLGIA